jgi:hypothetical protein
MIPCKCGRHRYNSKAKGNWGMCQQCARETGAMKAAYEAHKDGRKAKLKALGMGKGPCPTCGRTFVLGYGHDFCYRCRVKNPQPFKHGAIRTVQPIEAILQEDGDFAVMKKGTTMLGTIRRWAPGEDYALYISIPDRLNSLDLVTLSGILDALNS